MPVDGWRSLRLGDFVTLQRGHDLPIQLRRPGNVPILGYFGVTGTHDEAKAKGPGVTVGRSGASFGVVSYCPIDYWPLNTALYVVDFHGNDQRFAYYFLRSIDFSRFNSGSAQPSLNRNYIHPIPIEVPPPREQRSIAELLGSLDDKIDLNRRINETLKAMARAIFKSWFVDFDPARAKMEGRQPVGMEPFIAEVFPTEFVESEIGHIPQGWQVQSVFDCASFTNGSAFRNEQFSASRFGLPVIKIGELKYGITDQTKFTEDVLPDKYLVQNGDILFSWSGSPDTSIDTFVWQGGRGWLNQHVFNVGFNCPAEKYFVYSMLRSLKPVFIEIARNKQTTGLGHVTAQDLKRLKIVHPPDPVIEVLNGVAEPLFERAFACVTESMTLAELRDALLPKLLSGEIRVKDAEKTVETHT